MLPTARAYKVPRVVTLALCHCHHRIPFSLTLCLLWQGIDELGHNFYKLQAYFLTHFLYVVSEWGKHELPPELFWEELQFIVTNVKHVSWCSVDARLVLG